MSTKLVRLPTAGTLNPISNATVTPGNLTRVQDNVSKAINQLQPSTQHVPSGVASLPGGASPIAGAIRHSVAFSGTTAKDIPHKLGKPWTGYQIVSQDGVSTVYAESGNYDKSKYIRLKPSATHNCTILVF